MSNPSADMFRAQVQETSELLDQLHTLTLGPVGTSTILFQVLQNQCHIMQGMANIIETIDRLES